MLVPVSMEAKGVQTAQGDQTVQGEEAVQGDQEDQVDQEDQEYPAVQAIQKDSGDQVVQVILLDHRGLEDQGTQQEILGVLTVRR